MTALNKKIKLSDKQKEIVRLMQDGFPLMIGTSETSGRQFYLIASTHNKGLGNTYFTARVFSALLAKGLIFFDNGSFDYELTELGKTCKI